MKHKGSTVRMMIIDVLLCRLAIVSYLRVFHSSKDVCQRMHSFRLAFYVMYRPGTLVKCYRLQNLRKKKMPHVNLLPETKANKGENDDDHGSDRSSESDS